MKKDWNILEQECIAVSFYAAKRGEGGALREQIVALVRKGAHMDGRLLRRAENKAKELGAQSFRMWVAIPRAFNVYYPGDDDS